MGVVKVLFVCVKCYCSLLPISQKRILSTLGTYFVPSFEGSKGTPATNSYSSSVISTLTPPFSRALDQRQTKTTYKFVPRTMHQLLIPNKCSRCQFQVWLIKGSALSGVAKARPGWAWPGMCPSKAPCSSCSCHTISHEVRTSATLIG